MNSNCPESIERKIWPYIDRELSAKEVAEISVHLKGCERCNKIYNQRAREAQLYRMAFVESPFGEDFARRFEVDFADSLENISSDDAQAEIFTFNPPLKHRRMAVMVSIGAIICVILLGVLLHDPGPLSQNGLDNPGGKNNYSVTPFNKANSNSLQSGIGRFENAVDEVVVTPIQVEQTLLNEFRPGFFYSQKSPSQPVDLELWDRSRVRILTRPWKMGLQQGSTQQHLAWDFKEGEAEFFIMPLDPPRTFKIFTPDAEIEVVGTEFRLSVYETGHLRYTELDVISGKVQVTYQDLTGNRIVKEITNDLEDKNWRLRSQIQTDPEEADPSNSTNTLPKTTSKSSQRSQLLDHPVSSGSSPNFEREEDSP